MSDIRKYSKLKAIGGHVTWTDRELFYAPFSFDDYLLDDQHLGVIKIVGRDVLCFGYRVDLRVPAISSEAQFTVNLLTGENDVVAGTSLVVNGTDQSAEKEFAPRLIMPTGSYWKARITVPSELASLTGRGLTLTYQLSYANGPVFNAEAAFTLDRAGIGYWVIGQDFEVK